MNILFFTRLFYPHIGGVEKHVLELSKNLIAKGHKVTIITEDLSTADIPIYLQSKKIPLHEIYKGISIYRIYVGENNWFKKFRIWRELFKLKKLIDSAKIVHCHDVFFWYLPFRFLFPFKKVYITFHGYENYPLKSSQIIMHKIAELLSRGNICIGHFMKKWYGTKANYISYGGVNAFDIKNQKSNIKNNSAVFIGRLDEQTGIKTYIKAVKLIRKKIPDFKFEIIGDGKFRKDIEKDFKVQGFKNDPQNYFQQYNFAFVSRYLSILEAMIVKRFVFAVYDNPLKKDYLEMTPFSKFISISNSASDLVSKISFYLKNPKEKERMVENAYSWAKKQTWDEIVNIYLKLWRAKS